MKSIEPLPILWLRLGEGGIFDGLENKGSTSVSFIYAVQLLWNKTIWTSYSIKLAKRIVIMSTE